MDYFSAIAPGNWTLARGIFATPLYAEKARSFCILEPITEQNLPYLHACDSSKSLFLDLSIYNRVSQIHLQEFQNIKFRIVKMACANNFCTAFCGNSFDSFDLHLESSPAAFKDRIFI